MDAGALSGAHGFRVSPCSVDPICTRGLLHSKKVKLMKADVFPGLPSHPFLLHFYPITSDEKMAQIFL